MNITKKKPKETNSLVIPPSDIDAEQALLGMILVNPDCLDEVVDKIKPEAFYDPRNKAVYEAMINLWNSNRPTDTLFVLSEIELKEKRVGRSQGVDKDYLIELTARSSLANNVDAVIKIIKTKQVLRSLVTVGDEIKEMASKESDEIGNILDSAQKKLYEVSIDNSEKNFIPIRDILLESFERLSDLSANPDDHKGVPTGFLDVDKKLGGLHNSDLVIVAARPSMGKTSFCLEVAKRIALKEQKGVAVFSLEMSKEQLVDKLLSSISGIDNWKIRTGKFENSDGIDEFSKLGEAIGVLAEAPIWIDDSGSLNVLELRSKARRLKTRHNVGVIVIDYLQLMSGSGNKNYSGNRAQEVSEISRGLKMLAKELDIPVIALSQLSRLVEGREDKRPMLSDLRESGSIEQDADVVMFIHREEMYHKETKRKGIADLIIAKHRHGETCSIELSWIGRLATFENLNGAKTFGRINE